MKVENEINVINNMWVFTATINLEFFVCSHYFTKKLLETL